MRANQSHDLFGPVNKFLCQSYDKAQVGFLVRGRLGREGGAAGTAASGRPGGCRQEACRLPCCAQTCLKEFADWLVARGASDGQGNRFTLPCPIEGDKVGGGGGAPAAAAAGTGAPAPARLRLALAAEGPPPGCAPAGGRAHHPPHVQQGQELDQGAEAHAGGPQVRAQGGPPWPRQGGCTGCAAGCGERSCRPGADCRALCPHLPQFALVLMERGEARTGAAGGGQGRPPVATLQREDFAGAGPAAGAPMAGGRGA